MKRDLEIYGGASKTASGTIKGGLNRAWMDVKASISGGDQHLNIADTISREELSLKKAYEDALKSYGIASSLNGLLVEHIRKIEGDLSELHSLFGTEPKFWTGIGQTTVNTEQQQQQQQQHSLPRKQSIGDKIKSTFGWPTTQHTQHEKAIEGQGQGHVQQETQQQLSGQL